MNKFKFLNAAVPALLCCTSISAQQVNPEMRLTDPQAGIFFKSITAAAVSPTKAGRVQIIIDPKQRYQTIDGFGFTLTGGSAMVMMKMTKPARAALIRELFATDRNNIGTSYLRVSIGASDLDDHVFSYDDIPPGETDTALQHFSLGVDTVNLVPVLKEILTVNPAIKILGSPWSPPVWMKTNGDTRGGSLRSEYYKAYADYFVKYVKAMKQKGITIDAVTVQNEPLHPGNNPSLFMPAPEQAEFVKSSLGPAFKRAGLKTRIIVYDHNADKPDYPISVLNDPEAKKYIDGSAFHLYGGKVEALSVVHDAHPDKAIYFTEQWVGAPGNFASDIAWHTEQLIIGATRNWSRNVLEWNLASDPQYNPHTDRGGCTSCLGAVTIGGDSVVRNPAYYIIAHAAKWVRPGSCRVNSNVPAAIPNVAFRTADGKLILIAINTASTEKIVEVSAGNKRFSRPLPAGAVATFRWD